jgi:hypothetical protein
MRNAAWGRDTILSRAPSAAAPWESSRNMSVAKSAWQQGIAAWLAGAHVALVETIL